MFPSQILPLRRLLCLDSNTFGKIHGTPIQSSALLIIHVNIQICVDLFRPGLVVNDCSIDVFNSVEMSKAPVVINNEACVNCQRVLISGITDAQHVSWWLLEPTQRYTSTNPPLNIPGPLCALTGVSSPANIHQRAEEKLLLILTEFGGLALRRLNVPRHYGHSIAFMGSRLPTGVDLDWIRTSMGSELFPKDRSTQMCVCMNSQGITFKIIL